MKKYIGYLGIFICTLLLDACGTEKSSIGAFFSFETEYLGSELDGSITLRAWGDGNTRNDAIEQAMKNAVYDVVFKGISRGNKDYNQKALVLEPNAREKHDNYFNHFFRDKGEYRKYVNLNDEKRISKQIMENRQVFKYGVTVRVDRAALKMKLQQDQIIK